MALDGEIVDLDDSIDLSPPPPSIVVKYGSRISRRLKRNLRECQKEALDDLVGWFRSDESRPELTRPKRQSTAVVVMPTGSGKTGVICSLPYWFGEVISNGELHDIDLQRPILVIAPGLDILKQLESDLIESAGTQSCFLVKVNVIKNDQQELRHVLYTVQVTTSTKDVPGLRSCQANIVLTNAQKWRNQETDGPTATWQDLDDDLFSIIIVDEAHHLPAPQWQKIISKFENHAKVIFFTATPYRTDGKLITDSIKTYGFAHSLNDSVAVNKRIIREIQFESNLIRFGVGEHRYRYDPKNVDVHNRCTEAVVDKVIERILTKEPLPDGVPHCAILITANTSDAESVADLCRQRRPDLIVEHVHSTMRGKERRVVMDKIDRKEVRIFVIVKMLLEGFDYPRISVAGIVTRISSLLIFAQFVGRARRVICGENNVAADIITHEYFEQEQVYEKFKTEHLIPIDDAGED